MGKTARSNIPRRSLNVAQHDNQGLYRRQSMRDRRQSMRGLTESESRGPPPLRINSAVRFGRQQEGKLWPRRLSQSGWERNDNQGLYRRQSMRGLTESET